MAGATSENRCHRPSPSRPALEVKREGGRQQHLLDAAAAALRLAASLALAPPGHGGRRVRLVALERLSGADD